MGTFRGLDVEPDMTRRVSECTGVIAEVPSATPRRHALKMVLIAIVILPLRSRHFTGLTPAFAIFPLYTFRTMQEIGFYCKNQTFGGSFCCG
jgi:hypothetical protein